MAAEGSRRPPGLLRRNDLPEHTLEEGRVHIARSTEPEAPGSPEQIIGGSTPDGKGIVAGPDQIWQEVDELPRVRTPRLGMHRGLVRADRRP